MTNVWLNLFQRRSSRSAYIHGAEEGLKENFVVRVKVSPCSERLANIKPYDKTETTLKDSTHTTRNQRCVREEPKETLKQLITTQVSERLPWQHTVHLDKA